MDRTRRLVLAMTGVVALIGSPPLTGAEGELTDVSAPTDPRNNDESWYFSFGTGLAFPQYGGAADTALSSLKPLPGYDRSSTAIDFGFYWPVKDDEGTRTMVGPALIGIVDEIKANGYRIEIVQVAITASAFHYFGENIGDGFFVRGDIGPARFGVEATAPGGSTLGVARSDWGVGGQVGGGYSFLLSNETRLGIGAYSSYGKVKGDTAQNYTFGMNLNL